MPEPTDYVWVEDIATRPDDYDDLGHVGNAAIARLLDIARTDWFRSLPGREAGKHVVVRLVTISYENEALAGQALRCGVRALSRTTKSITVDQLLWRSDDDPNAPGMGPPQWERGPRPLQTRPLASRGARSPRRCRH